METMYSVISYGSKVVLLTSSRKVAMSKFFHLSYNRIPCRVVIFDSKIIAETRF